MFAFRKQRLAQALSIVAENGVHGMSYNGLLSSWCSHPGQWVSKRMRVTVAQSPEFSGSEFENYMILAWRMGLVDRSRYKELDWKHGPNKSSYEVTDEIIRLTPKGWEYMSEFDRPLLHRWWQNIVENVPSIIIATISAVLTAWAIFFFGAPK